MTSFFSQITFTFLLIILVSSCKETESAIVETDETENVGDQVVLTDAQFKLAALTTTKIKMQKMGGLIHLNGICEVAPENLINVNVPLGGFVKSIKMLPGMSITKGQVLAVIEDKEFIQLQQDYLMTKSALFFAQKEYERQKELNKTQASSDKVLLQSEEIVRSKSIEMKGLEQKLKLIQINPFTLTEAKISAEIYLRAPVNGIVKDVMTNTGKYVQPIDPILQILDVSKIMISLKAFEKDVVRLSKGDQLKVYTNTKPSEKWAATISYIGPSINAEGFTEVICTITNKSNLYPGTYVLADIETASLERYAVPEEAIVSYEGQDYIFFESGDREYKMVEVSTGIHENGYIEIANSDQYLSKNIVLSGAYTLLMKMKNIAE